MKKHFKWRRLKARISVFLIISTMLLSGCNNLFGGKIEGADANRNSAFDEFKNKNNLKLSQRGGLDITLNFDGNYDSSKYSSSYGDAFYIAEDLSNSTDDLNYFEFLDVIDNTYMVYVYQTLKYANNQKRETQFEVKEVTGSYVMYPEVVTEVKYDVSDTLVTVFAVYDYRAKGKEGYYEIGRWSAKKDSDKTYVMAINSYSENKQTQDLSTGCYCLCTMGDVMVYKKSEVMNCVSKNKYGMEISGTDGKTITPITYDIDKYYKQYLKENQDLANKIKDFEIDIFNIGCKVDDRGYYIYVDMSATNSNIAPDKEDEDNIMNDNIQDSDDYSEEDYAKVEAEVEDTYGSGSYDFLCTIVNADVDDVPIVCEPHGNDFFYEYMDTWDYPYDEKGYHDWIYSYYGDVVNGAPTWDLQFWTCTARIGVDIGGSTYYLTEQSGLNPLLCGYVTSSISLLDNTRLSEAVSHLEDWYPQSFYQGYYGNYVNAAISMNNKCGTSFNFVEVEKYLLDLYEKQIDEQQSGRRIYNLTPTKPITGNHIIVNPDYGYCYNSDVPCNIKVSGYLQVARDEKNVNKLNAYVHRNENVNTFSFKEHSRNGEPKPENFNMVLTDAHMEGVSFSNFDASSSESLFVHDNCIVGWKDDTQNVNGQNVKGKKFYLIPNSMSSKTPIAGDYQSNWMGITQFLTGHNFKKLEMKVTDDKDYIYAIANDYLVAYQVKDLNTTAAQIYQVDLSKFQVNKTLETEEELSVSGVLSEDNKLLLGNREKESSELSEFLKNIEAEKGEAIDTATGNIVPISFPLSNGKSEMVTLFFDNEGVQIYDNESIRVGKVTYEDIDNSNPNILTLSSSSSINKLFEDETIRKYWYVSSNSATGKLINANGEEIYSIASKIKENLHYRYSIALEQKSGKYNVTVTDKSKSNVEVTFTYDANTDFSKVSHVGIDNNCWQSITDYLKSNTTTLKSSKKTYKQGSQSFSQYSARNLTLMSDDFEGQGFKSNYWVSTTSLYGLAMLGMGDDEVFIPTFQRVQHTMNTTHVSNYKGEAISDEQALETEIVQLEGISCYGIYQNTGKDKSEYPYIFIGFDNQDNLYTENELVRAKVIPFGIKSVWNFKYTDSEVKQYLSDLKLGENADPKYIKPLDGESAVYYLKDTYVNKNGQRILNKWEDFVPMEPTGEKDHDDDDPGQGGDGDDDPGRGDVDEPDGPGGGGGDDDDDDDPSKKGDNDDDDDPGKKGDGDDDDDPSKKGDGDDDDDPSKKGDGDDDDDPSKKGDGDDDDDPSKKGDGDDDDDPSKKKGDGDDDDDPSKKKGDGDDDDDPSKKKGDGDDDDDPNKKGDGDDDDDPNKKGGNGDGDNERKGQKLDDNSGDSNYSGKVEDNKPTDLFDINGDADDGRSIKDKIKDYLGEDDSLLDEDGDGDEDGNEDESLLDQLGDKLKEKITFKGEKISVDPNGFGDGIGIGKKNAFLEALKKIIWYIVAAVGVLITAYVVYRKKKGLPVIPDKIKNLFKKKK